MIIKHNLRFRWVALQLNELKECRTRTDLTKQLANLPQGLEKTYDQMLLGIKKKDCSYVKLFLQLLSFAFRPLSLMELAATAAVDLSAENGPKYKSDNELQDIKDVFKMCSGFVMESRGIIYNDAKLKCVLNIEQVSSSLLTFLSKNISYLRIFKIMLSRKSETSASMRSYHTLSYLKSVWPISCN